MTCEERMVELSALMDGEIAGSGPTGLFAHLEGCPECRAFLDSLLHFRGAARRDRERALREAEALLPAEAPLPATAPSPSPRAAAGWHAEHEGGSRPLAGRPRAARWGWLGAWLRPGLPAPATLALAALLLIAGIAIGAGLAARVGHAPQRAPDAEMAKQPPGGLTVVYVCAMPQVEVVAKPDAPTGE